MCIIRPDPQQSEAGRGGLGPAKLIKQPTIKRSANGLADFKRQGEQAKKMQEEAKEDGKRRGDNAFRPFNHEIPPYRVSSWLYHRGPLSAAMAIQHTD